MCFSLRCIFTEYEEISVLVCIDNIIYTCIYIRIYIYIDAMVHKRKMRERIHIRTFKPSTLCNRSMHEYIIYTYVRICIYITLVSLKLNTS